MKISTKEKIEMAQTLIEKAIMVSETTKHDVFVYYSPHVNIIDVDIHTGGWKRGIPGDRRFTIKWYSDDTARQQYNTAIEALDKLAADKADGAEEESPGDRGNIAEAQG